MEYSSSCEKETVRHQFDRLCQLALEGEAASYFRHLDYRKTYEALFCELSERELAGFCTTDEYVTDSHLFQVLGYDVEVKNELLAEALELLTEKKRDVILLSYFMDMSDAEIAREMNLVRCTIHEHRKRSLELLRKILEDKTDGRKN